MSISAQDLRGDGQVDDEISFKYRSFKEAQSPEEIIKEITSNSKKIKDFKGSLVSKVFLEEESIIYQTNLHLF
jgi:hypothetical protein